jgi:hypothetical protein
MDGERYTLFVLEHLMLDTKDATAQTNTVRLEAQAHQGTEGANGAGLGGDHEHAAVVLTGEP